MSITKMRSGVDSAEFRHSPRAALTVRRRDTNMEAAETSADGVAYTRPVQAVATVRMAATNCNEIRRPSKLMLRS